MTEPNAPGPTDKAESVDDNVESDQRAISREIWEGGPVRPEPDEEPSDGS